MSEIKSWKCDVCGEIFPNSGDDQQYKNNYEIVYFISSDDIVGNSERVAFDDVCKNCHEKFLQFIYSWNVITQ